MRDSRGMHLVEALIAVVLSGIMMAAIMKNLTSSQRFSTSVKNQVVASDLVQEIVDNARNLSWTELTSPNIVGFHVLRVNQITAGQANDPFFPRPLLQDQANLTYTQNATKAKFHGDVEDSGQVAAQIVNLNNGSVRLFVQVRWRENGGVREVRNTTTISQTGIHN